MKIKVPNDLLIGIKEYFIKSAFTFQHRKTLDEIKQTFPLSPHRTIRKGIELLRLQPHGMMIATGGKGHKGYFLVDPNNKQDKALGWIHYKKLMKHNGSIYLSALPFKKLKPSDQLTFEEAV